MKLTYLKASGFRGIKGQLELYFPEGFVVVCGRNGTGKSSVCDAIEFAISGQVQKHGTASESREDFSSYLWWRGNEQPLNRFVTLGFTGSDGRESSITRTASGVLETTGGEVLKELCDEKMAPHDSFHQLCLTTLFRDDDITQLSVDMSESDRFNFVKNALGGADFTAIEAKAKGTYESLSRLLSTLGSEYQRERDRVLLLKTQLSQATTRVLSEADVSNAQNSIREILPSAPTEIPNLLAVARNEVAKLRVEIDALVRISEKLRTLRGQLAVVITPDYQQKEKTQRELLENLKNRVASLESNHKGLATQLTQKEQEAPLYANLAQMLEHGTKVGLLDGRCPLCNSTVSAEHFDNHITELKSLIEQKSKEVGTLATGAARVAEELRLARVDLRRAEEDLKRTSEAPELLRSEVARLGEESEVLGVILAEGEELNEPVLSASVENRRAKLSKLESAVALLDVSSSVEQVTLMQRDLVQAQEKVIGISEQLNRTNQAGVKAKETWDCIRRVSGEIVDDRLAELSPLLAELFIRLRPHVDWRDLSYVLRGDVRKFLRLSVGEDLNPRFMFSSGQRRAVGLAFLLAVYLSRHWCRLKSLVLDDPIQHIDDYRALHLVEVLSAIRQIGHQVICTVEDPALASLLCRRLRSIDGAEGALVDLAYTVGKGVNVDRVRQILPLNSLIVQTA